VTTTYKVIKAYREDKLYHEDDSMAGAVQFAAAMVMHFGFGCTVLRVDTSDDKKTVEVIKMLHLSAEHVDWRAAKPEYILRVKSEAQDLFSGIEDVDLLEDT
jgi:ERCC4-type nuclease